MLASGLCPQTASKSKSDLELLEVLLETMIQPPARLDLWIVNDFLEGLNAVLLKGLQNISGA